MRKARTLEGSLDGQAQRFGRARREPLEGVMASVYAAREGPPPTPLRVQHAQAPHAKTAAPARELLNEWDTF